LVHGGAFCAPVFAHEGGRKPTFTRDVARILQKNCQVCHRPGEVGPFSLLTYEQTRPGRRRFGKRSKQKRCRHGFDAALFFTGGTLEMDDQQKADFLSFIHDDGKGYSGFSHCTRASSLSTAWCRCGWIHRHSQRDDHVY
jgi:hypothetical protein